MSGLDLYDYWLASENMNELKLTIAAFNVAKNFTLLMLFNTASFVATLQVCDGR